MYQSNEHNLGNTSSMQVTLILLLLCIQAFHIFVGYSGEILQRKTALISQDSPEEVNSKYPKRVTENPQALPGPQYSSIDWHVHVIGITCDIINDNLQLGTAIDFKISVFYDMKNHEQCTKPYLQKNYDPQMSKSFPRKIFHKTK